jgi:hypothetical protein
MDVKGGGMISIIVISNGRKKSWEYKIMKIFSNINFPLGNTK